MMSMFTRQPWSVSSDTLLFELDNSKNKSAKKECYKFEFIYVTVRAYGIPASNKSFKVLKDILELVGTQSEFHELRQVMLTSRQDYIWGIARMKVCTPVLDRIKLKFSETESGMTYLHYEKIGQICLFCGVMFHTSQNCPLRQQIVMEKLAQDMPYQRYGPWIINPDLIPNNFAVHGPGSNPVFSTFQNPDLSRFQRLFECPQTRKSMLEATSTASQIVQLQSNHEKKLIEAGEGSSAMEENHQGGDNTVLTTSYTIQGANQMQSDAFNKKMGHEGQLRITNKAAHSSGHNTIDGKSSTAYYKWRPKSFNTTESATTSTDAKSNPKTIPKKAPAAHAN
uniref:Uncharacterized protein n=1 Tax=Avena sativa TaxID=4498 RepID=A0ACD5TJI4_AVESA